MLGDASRRACPVTPTGRAVIDEPPVRTRDDRSLSGLQSEGVTITNVITILRGLA